MHQFLDIGRSGFIKTRKLSCHRCSECMALRPSNCANREFCGPLMTAEVKLKSSNRVDVPLLRSMPALKGSALAATLKVGDLVAIELDSVQLPWVIAEVLVPLQAHSTGSLNCWMGSVRDHDKVLLVRRLEASRGGSSLYSIIDKETHVFDTDVRLVVTNLMEKVDLGSSGRASGSRQVARYTLPSHVESKINELCASTTFKTTNKTTSKAHLHSLTTF